jgi:hypothetical protein
MRQRRETAIARRRIGAFALLIFNIAKRAKTIESGAKDRSSKPIQSSKGMLLIVLRACGACAAARTTIGARGTAARVQHENPSGKAINTGS